LHRPRAQEALAKLIAASDAVLLAGSASERPLQGIEVEELRSWNPRSCITWVSHSGRNGKGADLPGAPISDFAASGVLSVTGFKEGPPSNAPGLFVYDIAGVHAAAAVLLGLLVSQKGSGQVIDISIQDAAIVGLYSELVSLYSYRWQAKDFDGVAHRGGAGFWPVLPCKDGWVKVVMPGKEHWLRWWEMIGSPDALAGEEWYSNPYRRSNYEPVYWLSTEYTSRFTMRELFEEAQRRRVPLTPLLSLGGYMDDPHTMYRQSVRAFDQPGLGEVQFPVSPLRIGGLDPSLTPAPTVGQHTEEVLREIGCEEGLVQDAIEGALAR
jgi:crotonobetainyl-CoA:carnitine CoA-transferase CaiB-like acyl-CoA transferase